MHRYDFALGSIFLPFLPKAPVRCVCDVSAPSGVWVLQSRLLLFSMPLMPGFWSGLGRLRQLSLCQSLP